MAVTVSDPAPVSLGDRSWAGGSSRPRRRSWSWRRPVAVMVNPRQPADARSSTAQTSDKQLCSPGSRPITLTRRPGLPDGALDEVGVADPGPVFAGEAQVDGQAVAVGEEAAHRGRVGVAPASGERLDPVLHGADSVCTGLDAVGHVEDGPVVGLDLGLRVLRDL